LEFWTNEYIIELERDTATVARACRDDGRGLDRYPLPRTGLLDHTGSEFRERAAPSVLRRVTAGLPFDLARAAPGRTTGGLRFVSVLSVCNGKPRACDCGGTDVKV